MPSPLWQPNHSSSDRNYRLEFALRVARKHLPATVENPVTQPPQAVVLDPAGPPSAGSWRAPSASDPVLRLVIVDDHGFERRIRIRITAFRTLRRLFTSASTLWRSPSEASRSVLS